MFFALLSTEMVVQKVEAFPFSNTFVSSFGPGTLKIGSRGRDVRELQGRLQFLGYYRGKIDGYFGYQTLKSVRWFQGRFGLRADGIVGSKTKLKLWQATKNWRPGITSVSTPILRRWARGGYVWEMQNRLKFLGFYTGPVHGVFDERTENAVRLFQYRFGLKVDGLVGAETKRKLYLATKNWKQQKPAPKVPAKGTNRPRPVKNSYGLSQQDIELLAKTVHAEARGEPYVGQVAVAAVILNRLESELFPNTITGIVFQPLAFEAVADGQIWLQPDESAKKAVMDALNGWDPSGGALYYFNPARATSKWIWSRPQIKRIGKHIFCK